VLSSLKIITKKIGIDEAIALTVFSRFVQASGGIISLLFVAKSLTKVEQGYYYTFGSILAIQIFFELGLSNIITQFVAHENAHLSWNSKTSFSGSEESSSRLASLLRFSVKWYAVISVLLFFGLILAGYIFFSKYGRVYDDVKWQIPWVILSITTSLSLLVSPVIAFFEGLGWVKEVAKIRIVQQVVQICFALSFFSLDFKLFSVPVSTIFSFSAVLFWIFFGKNRELLSFVWNQIGDKHVNYRLEIFPYQWRIAISWISGYFIFQLFNPVLFATDGAVVAGQMGMTLTVLNAIMALAFSWMSTKVPMFSGLIAKKDYAQLDSLFNKTLIQSSLINGFALLVLFGVILYLRHFEINLGGQNIGDRFLPCLPMLFMMIPIFLNHYVSSWATYLRCHKVEPMLVQSVVMGLLCSLSTILFGHYFGVIGITTGYLVLSIIGFVWTYFLYTNSKNEWHGDY
jgi:O-antigen/teichoic acid export membrane protein